MVTSSKGAPIERAPERRGKFPRRHFLAGLAAGLALPALHVPRARAADLTFRHTFGEVTLAAPATRVVSLGYTSQDPLLALGLPPLAIRYWYGDYPYGVWPWAQPYLGDAKPDLLTGEVSMERVAALQPDLIVGIGSGITESEYAILSQIAPVLMHEEGRDTYGTPWDVLTLTLGRALGKSAEAEALVAGVRAKFAAARQRHPDWQSKQAVAAYHWSGETGAFIGPDTRKRFLTELGFVPTAGVAALSGSNGFYASISSEDLSPLDADLLVWISSFDKAPDLVNLPLRKTLKAHRDGREVFAGTLLAAAMSFGSVLSLPFALENLENEIAAAMDGDPATEVPSAVAAGLAP